MTCGVVTVPAQIWTFKPVCGMGWFLRPNWNPKVEDRLGTEHGETAGSVKCGVYSHIWQVCASDGSPPHHHMGFLNDTNPCDKWFVCPCRCCHSAHTVTHSASTNQIDCGISDNWAATWEYKSLRIAQIILIPPANSAPPPTDLYHHLHSPWPNLPFYVKRAPIGPPVNQFTDLRRLWAAH